MILYECQLCSRPHLSETESADRARCPETGAITRIINPKVFQEQEWNDCKEPELLLAYLRDKESARKLRLFACACASQCIRLAPHPVAERLIGASMDFAEGILSRNDLEAAHKNALSVPYAGFSEPRSHAYTAALATANLDAVAAAIGALRLALRAQPTNESKLAQVSLVRECFFSPFRRQPAVEPVPLMVLRLANRLYQNGDRKDALREALRHIGRDDLSDHFASPLHPKGCWAMDMLLSKK